MPLRSSNMRGAVLYTINIRKGVICVQKKGKQQHGYAAKTASEDVSVLVCCLMHNEKQAYSGDTWDEMFSLKIGLWLAKIADSILQGKA